MINPTTTEVIAKVPKGDAKDAARTVDAAREAFDKDRWPRMAPALDFANDSLSLETDYGKRLTMSAEPKPTQLPSKDDVTERAGH